MTEEEKAALLPLLSAIDRRLQCMERHHPDGSPKTTQEIKREIWQWLRLAAWQSNDPKQ